MNKSSAPRLSNNGMTNPSSAGTTTMSNINSTSRLPQCPLTSLSAILLAMTAILLVVTAFGPCVIDAKAMHEIYPAYKARSQYKALKQLDSYAFQNARPRFGKRFGNEKMPAVVASGDRTAIDLDDMLSTNGAGSESNSMGSVIGDRWILINRSRPLTKLTETYLREILAENERYRENGSVDVDTAGK